MPTATMNKPNLETAPDASSGEMMAVGLALRFAFVGAGALVLGAIALFEGSMTPLDAVVLAACGGGIALASIAYLQRWTRRLGAPAAASAAAPRLHRTSMHQPV